MATKSKLSAVLDSEERVGSIKQWTSKKTTLVPASKLPLICSIHGGEKNGGEGALQAEL